MTQLRTSDHIATLRQAVLRMDLTPEQVRWHYIQLAHHSTGRNVTKTAEKLGIHRRTLQRVLAKRLPTRSEVSHG
ncbi:Homeodomain-like domain-containing protein [Devosia crocina]|uniref:Homeodomain-like domain-containing protein n=1 Tax=Devosia crocina TaxID=429728 RepID=A0A1I7N992_9HYPH|nr:helix-turn-helix domain-containing protein [Devosia crocina]SFV31237.1 Homeodomain-like domain-containing protein [Devosia crocina]